VKSVTGVELPVDRLAPICARYSVRELAVFGSAARGEMRPESDVDLLVDFKPEARVGLIQFARLNEELEQVIGRTVDLVTKTGLKPWLRAAVLREARLLYAA
jgi:uncharacterized protein